MSRDQSFMRTVLRTRPTGVPGPSRMVWGHVMDLTVEEKAMYYAQKDGPFANYACARWALHYADGSSVVAHDRTFWESAPQNDVVGLEVWWDDHAPLGWRGERKGYTGQPYYIFPQGVGYPCSTWCAYNAVRESRKVKFGMWVSPDIMERAQLQAIIERSPNEEWVLYYADGTRYGSNGNSYALESGLWVDAPLDGVLIAWEYEGQLQETFGDYFLWTPEDSPDGAVLKSVNGLDMAIQAVPEIKIAHAPSIVWDNMNSLPPIPGDGT